jgi:hypothetical protein
VPGFSKSGIFFSKVGENFRELYAQVRRIGALLQLPFEKVFCFQEGGPRAGFVVEGLSRKPNQIILAA